MKREYFILNQYINIVKNYCDKARKLGVLEYVLSDIFQKVIIFVGGFVIVRILTKEDYGSYTYILNTFNIFYLFGDFGISAAVLQYASVNYLNEEKRKMYIRYGRNVLRIVSGLSVVGIFLISFVYRFTIEGTRELFCLLIFLPAFKNEINYFQMILRVELRNKIYAGINFMATIIHYIALIGMAIFMGLEGAVAAVYPEVLVVLIMYIVAIKPTTTYQNINVDFTQEEKKIFWKFAILMQINQMSLAVLNYLDIYCLGITIKQPEIIAEYKVASTIPTALYFIPKSIMFFMVPLMGRKKQNLDWTKKAFGKIVFINFILCLSITIIFSGFFSVIIRIVYGTKYAGSRMSFLVLLIGFVVYGVLQAPASNILVVQEKLKVIIFTSVMGAVLNIILNIWLINMVGSVGAAIATLLSHLFVGGILTLYLVVLFRRNKYKK